MDKKQLIKDGRIEKAKLSINEFGEPFIPLIEQHKLTEKGKKEVNNAINVLRTYNSYIDPYKYYELNSKHIDLKKNYTQTKERINIGLFLGILWYVGFIYSLFLDKGKLMIFVFPTLILLIIIYLFVNKKNFETF